MEKLKEDFYNLKNEEEKKEKRHNINTKIRELLNSAEEFSAYKIEFDFKLFFSEVWREKGGFDVVIGNPPYVKVQNLKHSEIDFYKSNYDFAWKRIDISILFFEKGLTTLINQMGIII